MAKNCVTQCFRIMVIVFNFIFVLIGLALLALAAVILAYSTELSTEGDKFKIVLFVLIGIGSFTFILGTFGCCGAYHESQCLLAIYFSCLLIIIIAEVVVVALGFVYKDEVTTVVKKIIQTLVDGYNPNNKGYTVLIDTIQIVLKCCGGDYGPLDYSRNILIGQSVPASCLGSGMDIQSYFPTKCTDSVFLRSHLMVLLFIAIGIAVAEFFGFVFSLILFCSVRRYTVQYSSVNT